MEETIIEPLTSSNGTSVNNQKATGETPDIKREFILTQSADDALSEAVRVFSKATGASLTNSHFLRIVLKAIDHAMPEIEREAAKVGKLKRPSNARGKESSRDKFERKLARTLLAGMRASEPMA